MRKSNIVLSLSTAAITLSLFILVAACHKTPATTTTDTGFTTDQSTADKTFEDVETAADQAALTPSGSTADFRTTAGSGCATVTRTVVTSGTYINDTALTITFPSTGCTCLDGSIRSGQIIVYYSGAYADSGSGHTITFNNFYQNGNQVTGTKTVANMGHNSSGQLYFDVTVSGSIILADGVGTISETTHRIRTWITQGSPNVYSVYTNDAVGFSNMITRANGNVIGVSVSEATPLIFASDCRWIEAGTVDYGLPGGLTASMNYGTTANCDPDATLTYNGKTYDITLK